MVSFENWLKELTSDERWFEYASMHHSPKTFEGIGFKVYMGCVADSVFKPMPECRKHVYNILANIPGDKPKQMSWVDTALSKRAEEERKEWVPVSEEERQRRLAEFKALIDSMPIINNFPRVSYKEQIENGGWLPKKEAPYPITSIDEAYVKDRHLDYIKANYEPRTGKPLPNWIPEDEFNIQYENGLL